MFSHLISDDSLEELHAFAAEAGISERAFDRDHYDVPAHLFDGLVRLGAVEVSGHELVRVLAASGLRMRSRERPEKLRGGLRRRWKKLGGSIDDAAHEAWEAVGDDLIARWSEPHRHYHGVPHLSSVLRVSSVLDRAGELPRPSVRTVTLAAWFHDAVYDGEAGRDEEESARLAQRQMDGLLPDEELVEVARLVALTATHAPEAGDVAGSVLVDADLEVLGRRPDDYARYAAQVRADYAHVDDDQFAVGRAGVLRALLDRPRLFHTRSGYALWEGPARRNVEGELRGLESR